VQFALPVHFLFELLQGDFRSSKLNSKPFLVELNERLAGANVIALFYENRLYDTAGASHNRCVFLCLEGSGSDEYRVDGTGLYRCGLNGNRCFFFLLLRRFRLGVAAATELRKAEKTEGKDENGQMSWFHAREIGLVVNW
jgi:hypothetical protein